MQIFSFAGILFYILYLTVIDQAFEALNVPYSSPLKMIPKEYKDEKYTGPAIKIAGSIAVLALAAVLTRVTPKIF
jgi:hypothetical protein